MPNSKRQGRPFPNRKQEAQLERPDEKAKWVTQGPHERAGGTSFSATPLLWLYSGVDLVIPCWSQNAPTVAHGNQIHMSETLGAGELQQKRGNLLNLRLPPLFILFLAPWNLSKLHSPGNGSSLWLLLPVLSIVPYLDSLTLDFSFSRLFLILKITNVITSLPKGCHGCQLQDKVQGLWHTSALQAMGLASILSFIWYHPPLPLVVLFHTF